MLTLFKARSIITMNPSQPRAEAVLVRDGRIIEVGSEASMAPWLNAHAHQVDDRFADAVLTPGFIDPHLHPTMAAMILPMSFITALPWQLPWEDVPATTDAEGFDTRLQALNARAPGGRTTHRLGLPPALARPHVARTDQQCQPIPADCGLAPLLP